MTSNKPYLNPYLQILLGSLIVFFLAYCFHFNADLSDEGFYLYYFQQGHKAVSFNFYHVFVSPIGSLFSHYLIGYRYLRLVLILGSSLFLYFSMPVDKRRNNWLLPLCLGLLYFNLLSTFSYNTAVLCGASLALALNIKIQYSTFKKTISSILGILCFFSFSARFGSGIIILVLSSISFFLYIENKREAMKCIALLWVMFTLCFVIYLFMFKENFFLMLETLPAITKSTHLGLFDKYLSQTTRFILRSVFPPLLLGLLSLKYFPRKYFSVLLAYLSWFIVKNIFYEYDFSKFGYYASGLILTLAIIEIYTKYTKETFFYLLFPLALYFSSSLGTNNNLFEFAAYNSLLFYPLIGSLRLSSLKFQILSSLLFILALVGIYKNQYHQTYRSLPRSELTFVASNYPALRGIKVNQMTELKLANLTQMLTSSGFNFQSDQIVVYPNMPGLVSFLNLKAFGNPWNIDIYPKSHISNCIFYKVEPINAEGRVFLYSEKDLPTEMTECLKRPMIELHGKSQ